MSVDPAKSQSNVLPRTHDNLLGAQSCINSGSSPHSSTTDFIFVIISVLVFSDSSRQAEVLHQSHLPRTLSLLIIFIIALKACNIIISTTFMLPAVPSTVSMISLTPHFCCFDPFLSLTTVFVPLRGCCVITKFQQLCLYVMFEHVQTVQRTRSTRNSVIFPIQLTSQHLQHCVRDVTITARCPVHISVPCFMQ